MPLKRAGPLVVRPGKKARLTRAPTIDDVQNLKIAKLTRQVRSLNKAQETNYIDKFINVNISYDVNNAQHVTAIPNDGTGPTGAAGTRIGEKVSPTFMEMRGIFKQPLTAVENPTQVRMIVIQSKQRFVPSTTSITGANNVLANQNTVSSVFAPYDFDNRRHFYVLHDEVYTFTSWSTAQGAMTGEPAQRYIHFKKKLSRDICFEGTGTTPEAGQIYCLFYSNVAVANTEPTFEAFSRVYYKDG